MVPNSPNFVSHEATKKNELLEFLELLGSQPNNPTIISRTARKEGRESTMRDRFTRIGKTDKPEAYFGRITGMCTVQECLNELTKRSLATRCTSDRAGLTGSPILHKVLKDAGALKKR